MKWQEKSVPVSEYTVKSAVKWLWKLDHTAAASSTTPAGALVEAMSDEMVSSYIFSEASSKSKSIRCQTGYCDLPH